MKFRRNRRFSIHTQHQYICKDNANSRTRTPLTLYFIEWILGKFLKQRVQNWTTTTTKPTNRAVVCGISTFGNNHKNFKVPNYRFNERMKKWEKTRLKTFENSSACETVCLCVLYMKFSFLLSFADCIWFEVKWLFYAFVFCVLFFLFFLARCSCWCCCCRWCFSLFSWVSSALHIEYMKKAHHEYSRANGASTYVSLSLCVW